MNERHHNKNGLKLEGEKVRKDENNLKKKKKKTFLPRIHIKS